MTRGGGGKGVGFWTDDESQEQNTSGLVIDCKQGQGLKRVQEGLSVLFCNYSEPHSVLGLSLLLM